MNPTNDPALRSFIPVEPAAHFPIQNLPYGVFRRKAGGAPAVGVAIGDFVLDLAVIEDADLIDPSVRCDLFCCSSLNHFMEEGEAVWNAARASISRLLRHD